MSALSRRPFLVNEEGEEEVERLLACQPKQKCRDERSEVGCVFVTDGRQIRWLLIQVTPRNGTVNKKQRGISAEMTARWLLKHTPSIGGNVC